MRPMKAVIEENEAAEDLKKLKWEEGDTLQTFTTAEEGLLSFRVQTYLDPKCTA